MKFAYLVPAVIISACVACPYTANLSEAERENLKSPEDEMHRRLTQAITYPTCSKLASGASVVSSAANTCAAYSTVLSLFNTRIATYSSVKEKADLYGILVRLAFHDAAEVDITTTDILGPDGCLSSDSGHAGLVDSASLVYTWVEGVYAAVCDKITRADLWVMLAKMAIESAEPTGTITIDFQYGRKDAKSTATDPNGCTISGRLPSGEGTVDDMYKVFVTQMGMDLNDAATLLGAHTLGHVHPSYSGYGQSSDPSNGYVNGFDDTPHIFDNNYYYNMLTSTWVSSAAPAATALTQFQSVDYPNCVMIPADISIGYTRTTYASSISQTCSQWAVNGGYGCTPSNVVMPLTCWQTCNHGNSNAYFLSEFRKSFNKMTCAGYGVPACSTGASASGKLGTLYYLDLDTCTV